MTAQQIRDILLNEAARLSNSAAEMPPGFKVDEDRLNLAASGLRAVAGLSDNDVLRFREIIVGA